MVGVAGRSKACRTCRRRRKGCDYQRPKCLRCVNGGFECGGYDETHIVVYRPSGHEADNVKSLKSSSSLPGPLLPPSLENSAVRSAYLDAGWCSLHPKGGKPFSLAFLTDLSGACEGDTALHSAFAAIALARVGQQTSDKELVYQSRYAYHRAVTGVKRQLSLRPKAANEETVACVLILASYEALHGSPKERMPAMLAHLIGAREMIKMRGPDALQNTAGRVILREIRQNAFLTGIGSRKSTFLSRKKWLATVPPLSVKDKLLEVVADLPVVMEQFDLLKRHRPEEPLRTRIDSVHAKYMDLIDRLTSWRITNIREGTFYYEPSKTLRTPETIHLIKFCPWKRKYTSVEFAEMDVIYAMVQLMAHLDLLELVRFASTRAQNDDQDQDSSFSSPSSSPRLMEASGAESDPTHILQKAIAYATAIVESLEYFLEQHTGILAASSTVLPVLVVLGFLHKLGDARVQYIMALVYEYQRRTSFPIADMVMECMDTGVNNEGEAVRWKEREGALMPKTWTE